MDVGYLPTQVQALSLRVAGANSLRYRFRCGTEHDIRSWVFDILKTFVDVHHSIYPTVPPQGIYFEALVERTFRAIHKPLTVVRAGGVNQPRYDIEFEGHRISLKTETGLGNEAALHQHYEALHDRARSLGSRDAQNPRARAFEPVRYYSNAAGDLGTANNAISAR